MMSDAYKFVRENNIDHKISFNSMKIQLPKTITEPNMVYFGPKSFCRNARIVPAQPLCSEIACA